MHESHTRGPSRRQTLIRVTYIDLIQQCERGLRLVWTPRRAEEGAITYIAFLFGPSKRLCQACRLVLFVQSLPVDLKAF